MEQEAVLDILNRFERQIFIELNSSRVIFQKKDFIDPVHDEVEDAGYRVKDWEAT